jgi:hypothetical protein
LNFTALAIAVGWAANSRRTGSSHEFGLEAAPEQLS